MATAFLSTAITSLPSRLSSSPSSSSSSSSYSSLTKPALDYPHIDNNTRKLLTICKSISDPSPPTPILTKRALSLCSITSLFFSLAGKGCYSIANAAILEADDDVELMEKVKQDRKKRLERQGVVNSSKEEKGYLQELVYKLSKVGQAIDNNDLSAASSVLGGSTNSDWLKKANKAFTKLSSSPEEKSQVDAFNSSLASLISSVTRNDVESSKNAFVSSARAFEQWTTLTGLIEQLKGL